MTALLHPGIYVREVSGGTRSIEGVSTSTTIFVGETERGPTAPTKVRSVGEYERLFGGYLRCKSGSGTQRVATRYALGSFFANGGGAAYVLRSVSSTGLATAKRTVGTTTSVDIEASSPGAWGNGVYILFDKRSTSRFRLLVYVDNLSTGEIDLVEDWDRLSLEAGDSNFVEDVLERSLYLSWPEGGSIDIAATSSELPAGKQPSEVTSAELAGKAMTGGTGGDSSLATAELPALLTKLDGIDDAALLVATPDAWLVQPFVADYADLYDPYRSYVDTRPKQDLFLISDLKRGSGTASEAATSAASEAGGLTRSSMVGVYWPQLVVHDPVGASRDSRLVIPTAGAVAGLFARVDGRRGVWKAPAGTEASVNGIIAAEHQILDAHQDDLNPAGVNVIRQIPGAGVVAWGARTMKPASEWRYVSVRRTAMYLRKSIFNSIQWAVFEPNDRQLWDSLRTSIDSFMNIQFRNGAFAGRTANESYFVKVDEETTTAADQAAGIVNVLVGFAPLRPAEFVVVQLSQKTSTNS